MVKVAFGHQFQRVFSKIKDNLVKDKIIKQISKIKSFPEVGKPMKHARKGTREIYLGSFRLSYCFIKEEDKIVFLDFYHKDEQ